MMRRRIPFAVAMIAAGVLGAGCGGSSYSSPKDPVVSVTGVTLTKTSTFLVVGGDDQLVANVLPANAADKRLRWSTSNDKVVGVTTVGKITALAVGTATITVYTIDGGKTATCDVTVSADRIAVTGVTLDETKVSMPKGSSRTLTATLAPGNANNPALTWEIQPSGIANIAATGNIAKITGVKIGDATVTVTSVDNPKATATATVQVTAILVTGVTLGQSSLTLQAGSGTADGTSVPLTATVAPSDASNQDVTWTTSDAAVATLTSTMGSTVSVVAHKQGTATITVTTADGQKTATCAVKVDPPPAVNVAVQSVSVEPTNVGLEATPATTTIVHAYIQPADATNQGIYWTTSDKTVAAISPVSGGTATADSVSGSAVIVTAGKLGKAKLTATTAEGAKQAMVDVGVYMVDVEIPGKQASAFSAGVDTNPTTGVYTWDTKSTEVTVGKLVFYSNANGFHTASNGITINWYAADRSGKSAALGVPVPNAEAYVGITPEAMTPPPDVIAASLKVSVTASAVSGSPTVALIDHATKRPYAIKPMSEGPVFVFDGVDKGKQVDIIDGAGYGPALNISHVRVEPSGTAQQDIAPPPDVTNATATVASATSLTLNWVNPTVADFDHVEISSPSLAAAVTVPKTASTYTFTGLTTGTSYSYTIKTVDTTKLSSVGVTVIATPSSTAPLLDATIATTVTASFVKTSYYNTKSATTGQYSEIPVGPLVYFAWDNGFRDGDTDGGVMFAVYASGSTTNAVTVNATQQMKSYIGIPAANIKTSKATVKVTVTAKAYNGQYGTGAKIGLAQHTSVVNSVATGTVLAVQDLPSAQTTTKAEYVFNNVPANVQLDLFNGGLENTYMYIEAVRVE